MNRWKLCTIGDTTVSVHPIMFVSLLYAFVVGHGWFMVLATVSILLHECAHAMTAAAFGQRPHSIELTPLGAVMRLEDEACLPAVKRGLMLLAGPVMTLLLCWCALSLAKVHLISMELGRMLFLSNLSILLLNLLPALPLDGGRLLSLVLECLLPLRTVNRIMRTIGSSLGIGMILINLYISWKYGGWNLSLACAGCCLVYTAVIATTTQALAELRQLMDRKIAFERTMQRKICWIAVPVTLSLRRLIQLLPTGKMAMFIGLGAGTMKPYGWLSEQEIIQHYLQKPQSSYEEVLKMYPERLVFKQNSTI